VGISAGELSTVKHLLRGMPIRIAVGNSHLTIAAASICAAVTHLPVSESQGTQIPWNLVPATILAVLIGGQLAGLLNGATAPARRAAPLKSNRPLRTPQTAVQNAP